MLTSVFGSLAFSLYVTAGCMLFSAACACIVLNIAYHIYKKHKGVIWF